VARPAKKIFKFPQDRDSANWPMRAENYAGWRYIPLQQINQTNVEDLKIG
jgi:glucose dehydrogenase